MIGFFDKDRYLDDTLFKVFFCFLIFDYFLSDNPKTKKPVTVKQFSTISLSGNLTG